MKFTLIGWTKTTHGNYIVYNTGARPLNGPKLTPMVDLPGEIDISTLKFKETGSNGVNSWSYNYRSGELHSLTGVQLTALRIKGINTLNELVAAFNCDKNGTANAANKNRCQSGKDTFKAFMVAVSSASKHLVDPDWTAPVTIHLGLNSITVESLPVELNPASYDASVLVAVQKNLKAKVIELLNPILADAVENALKAKEAKAKADLKKVRALKS